MSARTVRTRITAHPGSLGARPDTLEAFDLALSYPVDCLSADVRFGDQNRIYLSPDPLTPQQQKGALSLVALLERVAGHPTVHLSLNIREPGDLKRLERLVDQAGLLGRVFLTGIPIDQLAAVRQSVPNLPYYVDVLPNLVQRNFAAACDQLVSQIREWGAIGLNTRFRFVTTMLQRTLAESDLRLSVWTVDHERDMRHLLALPVDNIVTRRIDLLIDVRSRLPQPRRPRLIQEP